MSSAVSQEEASVVWSEINEYLAVMQRHITMDDERYIDWQARSTRIGEPALAGARALCRALIAHMAGDAYGFEAEIGESRIAGAPQQLIFESQLIGYSNLTFGTKALDVFRRIVDIKYLNIQRFIQVGAAIGAFQRIEELVAQATKAKLELASLAALPAWRTAARILQGRNFTDEQCAKVVDVAGEVLRDRELFWLGLQPKVVPDEGQGVVLLRYRVATSPASAAEMTGQMVAKLIDAGLDDAPLLITFVGVQH